MPLPNPEPFNKVTAKDLAYKKIRTWIIDGTLMPNERLSETALATAVSVSRTPIREALLKLKDDGFVIMESGHTTLVAPLLATDAAKLYEPMAAIEGLAAQQAANIVSSQQIKEIEQLNETYQASLQSQNLTEVLLADRQVHEMVLKIANNEYETQFSNILYGHLIRYETYFFQQKTMEQPHKNENHDKLLSALKDHDATMARQAITEDWLNTMKVFQEK